MALAMLGENPANLSTEDGGFSMAVMQQLNPTCMETLCFEDPDFGGGYFQVEIFFAARLIPLKQENGTLSAFVGVVAKL